MRTTLIADCIFDGEKIHYDMPLSVEDGQVVAMGSRPNSKEIRLQGMLAPGYIDVQVNGGGGYLLNTHTSVEAIKGIAASHAVYGTTAMLPTLISDDLSVMQKTADAMALAIQESSPGVIGVHFEGPHLSQARRGVHQKQFLRPISDAELEIYFRNDLGIKLVTLAPEVVPVDIIKQLVEAEVHVCLGHSDADYETTKQALEAGASGFTHLFNAMSRLQARDPGMVGAALEDADSWCGIILDGHHVHPATLKIAHQSKPPGKIMLVTDAMSLLGTNDTHCHYFDTEIIRTGSRLNVPTGELAGSMLDMSSAVQNAVNLLQVSKEEALRMASLYPAEFLGIQQQKGRIAVGADADLVLLDDELAVQSSWIKGQRK